MHFLSKLIQFCFPLAAGHRVTNGSGLRAPHVSHSVAVSTISFSSQLSELTTEEIVS